MLPESRIQELVDEVQACAMTTGGRAYFMREALRTAAREAAELYKPWYDAVQDALVVDWCLNKDNENNPRKAINDLCCYSAKVALDPLISKEARDLQREAAIAENEACAKVCEGRIGNVHGSRTLERLNAEDMECAAAIRARREGL